MVLLGIPYRQEALPGYWGPTNSRANYCEEDYIVTAYIAEFINTLTNVTYVLYALRGIRANSNHKDAILRNLPYLGILSVGVGSTIFHATLKTYTQWFDELSMLIATATVLHRVYTFDQTLAVTVWAGVGMTAGLAAFSVYHCFTDSLLAHSALFGIMICAVGIQTRSIIGARISDLAVRKDVRKLATWGAVVFISGFGIWNLDNALCSSLTQTKRVLGMPWSFVFELHGWWHIFTGVGAYIYIALVEYLTSGDAGTPLTGRFAWPVGLIVAKTTAARPCRNGNAVRAKEMNGAKQMNGTKEMNGAKEMNGKKDMNGKKH